MSLLGVHPTSTVRTTCPKCGEWRVHDIGVFDGMPMLRCVNGCDWRAATDEEAHTCREHAQKIATAWGLLFFEAEKTQVEALPEVEVKTVQVREVSPEPAREHAQKIATAWGLLFFEAEKPQVEAPPKTVQVREVSPEPAREVPQQTVQTQRPKRQKEKQMSPTFGAELLELLRARASA